jgi:type II secretion system protein I
MNRRFRAGFTLVEVVIALAILAFALFGAISVISYTSRMNQASRERMLAVRAAERKIEQMLSYGDDLDGMFRQFRQHVEGMEWEQVDGLEPVDPAPLAPQRDPGNPAYAYPTWSPKVGTPPRRPVLFVRFPLNANGDSFTEVGSGQFANSYQVDPVTHLQKKDVAGNPLWLDMDFDQNTKVTDTILTTDTVAKIKQLPVSVQVYWRGTVGPKVGNAGNTYLVYNYTFLKKP